MVRGSAERVRALAGPIARALARLPGEPLIVAPSHGAAEDIAGQGVANPASMLLAAALMLGEGLGERGAAETLTGAVLGACSNGTQTPDMLSRGLGATTREFTSRVVSEFQLSQPWAGAA